MSKSSVAEKFTLRLPPELHEAVKKAAAETRLSMNQQIVHLLETSTRRLFSGVAEKLPDYDVSSGALPFNGNLLIAVTMEVDALLNKSPKKITAEQRAELVSYIYEKTASADPAFIKSAGRTEPPIDKELVGRIVKLVTG